jgi:hypothetical protein
MDFLHKTMYFLWQYYGKYMFSYHFVKKFDQILILLLLLRGNLGKESLNCPLKAVQLFIYL